MHFALRGVVLGLFLALFLGIGTTPTEAVNASKKGNSAQKSAPVCGEAYNSLCSESSSQCSEKELLDREIFLTSLKTAPVLSAAVFVKQTQPVTTASAAPELLPSIEPVITSPTPTPDGTQPAGLNADKLFSMINEKRTQAGLGSLEKNDLVCQVAQARAPELQSDVQSGYMHAGFYSRKPAYQSTENVIYMNSEEQAVNWWLNSPVHRSAIYGNYHQTCVVCSGNTCSQIFANVTDVTPGIQ